MKSKIGRVDGRFDELTKKLYPHASLRKRTQLLNDKIEEMLFGIRQK